MAHAPRLQPRSRPTLTHTGHPSGWAPESLKIEETLTAFVVFHLPATRPPNPMGGPWRYCEGGVLTSSSTGARQGAAFDQGMQQPVVRCLLDGFAMVVAICHEGHKAARRPGGQGIVLRVPHHQRL